MPEATLQEMLGQRWLEFVRTDDVEKIRRCARAQNDCTVVMRLYSPTHERWMRQAVSMTSVGKFRFCVFEREYDVAAVYPSGMECIGVVCTAAALLLSAEPIVNTLLPLTDFV